MYPSQEEEQGGLIHAAATSQCDVCGEHQGWDIGKNAPGRRIEIRRDDR